MLKTFIKFQPIDYCLEAQEDCIVVESIDHCDEHFDSVIPAKQGDTISFILDKTEHDLFVSAIHLKVALTECGIIHTLNIASIEESGSQYYITCILPSVLSNNPYEITIYKDYQLQVIEFTPETSEGACDAEFTVEVIDQPALDFEFSLDQETWNSSGIFTGLCMQPYTIYVREIGGECTEGQLEFNAGVVSCSDYKGFTLDEFIASGIFMIQLKDCSIDDLAP